MCPIEDLAPIEQFHGDRSETRLGYCGAISCRPDSMKD